jgi:hypothetical protein
MRLGKRCPCGDYYLISAGEDGVALCLNCGGIIPIEELVNRNIQDAEIGKK